MLALEDLVDLGAALRDAGFRPSTQQTFAAQQLLMRLAADAALPHARADLASYFGPIYCTSALEQDNFAPLFQRWLRQRFPDDAVPEPEPAPAPRSVPRRGWRPWALTMLATLVLVAAWLAWKNAQVPVDGPAGPGTAASQPAAASAPDPGAGAGGPATLFDAGQPRLVAQFDVADLLPPPTWFERLEWMRVLLLTLPGLLYALWQGIRLARRPVLQRLASRTPPRLREVFLPGGIRLLLPTLPLRRLAQELRRQRAVDSSELQVEPTIAATLRAGGVFSPVRGSRVEPEYLALIDRATLSDHQALLSAELVAELARSDVLIERYDFNRDATVCRPRPALASTQTRHAAHGQHTTRPAGAAAARAVQTTHAVELTELHERHPEHRVLLFGDGAGCFDGYTGEPMPWLATLLLWSLPVLLTQTPLARWGRREWALQRMGVQVLPLSRPGLLALVQFVAAGRGDGAGPAVAHPSALPLHERTPRLWLERDPPPPETIEPLCEGLRAELGPRGWAWLAACAAYPEVHWGITLRLGARPGGRPGRD